MHHPNAAVVAESRFTGALGEFAHQLLRALPEDTTTQDRQFLKDVARGEGRYKLVTLRRLSTLSRRSSDPAHREALAEIIRADTLAGETTDVSIEELFDEETQAQAECDREQLKFARNPTCPTKRQRLIQAAHRQLALTRRLLDRVAAL